MKKLIYLLAILSFSACSEFGMIGARSSSLAVTYFNEEIPDPNDVGIDFDITEDTDIVDFDMRKIGDYYYIAYISPSGDGNTWVRVFKGQYDESGFGNPNPKYMKWQTEFEILRDGLLSEIVVTLIRGEIFLIGITDNNKVYAFSNRVEKYDLFIGKNYSHYSQLNAVEMNGEMFVAVVADDTRILSGKISQKDILYVGSDVNMNYTITDFQVKAGIEYPYAVWVKKSDNQMIVSYYNYNSSFKNPWNAVAIMGNVMSPELKVDVYSYNMNGQVLREEIYIGTIHNVRKEFQLYYLNEHKQLKYVGQYIVGDNEDYSIAGNVYGQAIFVRMEDPVEKQEKPSDGSYKSTPDRYSFSLAGLNFNDTWNTTIRAEEVSLSAALKGTKVSVEFVDNEYPLIVYIQKYGHLYISLGKE